MNAVQIIDVDGVWVTNPHAFAFVDPETKVRFNPDTAVKVACAAGSWLASQMAAKVIVEAPDPTTPPPKVAKAPPGKAQKSAEG